MRDKNETTGFFGAGSAKSGLYLDLLMEKTTKKLVLHIGTGKAGSTSIQENLKGLNDPVLGVLPVRAFGFPNARLLAMATGSQQAHAYFVKKYRVLTEGEFENNKKTIWGEACKEIAVADVNNFVASSEFIGAMIRREHIAFLKERLDEIFDEIRIVIYLRDQRSFLRSLWAQSVKGPSKSVESFGDFMANVDRNEYLWNYSIFLQQWLRIFGSDSLSVTMFDSRSLHEGSVVSDFFNKANIHNKAICKSRRKNVSPSFEELEKIRNENILRAQPNLQIQEKKPGNNIDQDEYEALVLEKVSSGNKWVNETFFCESPVKLPVSV